MRKLVKGIYLISNSNNETIITLIPENPFSYENTRRILDKNNETSIVLQHHRKGGLLYTYNNTETQHTDIEP